MRIAIESIEAGIEGQDMSTALSLVTSESLRMMRENRAFIRFLMLEAQSSREQAEVVFSEIVDRAVPATDRTLVRALARASAGRYHPRRLHPQRAGRPAER